MTLASDESPANVPDPDYLEWAAHFHSPRVMRIALLESGAVALGFQDSVHEPLLVHDWGELLAALRLAAALPFDEYRPAASAPASASVLALVDDLSLEI